MPTYGFHPEALLEYAEAVQYYLQEAPPGVAEAFITVVESAVDGILAAPTQWRIIGEPGIRRVCLAPVSVRSLLSLGSRATARSVVVLRRLRLAR